MQKCNEEVELLCTCITPIVQKNVGPKSMGETCSLYILGCSVFYSVLAMQYVLDMTVNAKKSDNLVHKLPYKCCRIWPLVLWPLPENVEKLAYSEKFL